MAEDESAGDTFNYVYKERYLQRDRIFLADGKSLSLETWSLKNVFLHVILLVGVHGMLRGQLE